MRNTKQQSAIDFAAINRAALAHCPDLLSTVLPGGRPRGREYVTSGLSGGTGDSLSITMDSGVWKDFATAEGGRDLISLIAAVRGIGQGEAARVLSEMTGISTAAAPPRHQERRPAAIVPVPEGTTLPDLRHPRLGTPTATFT